MADGIARTYAHERDILLGDLAQLEQHQWSHPSLCSGWDVRDVVAHLLMPFELAIPAFLGRMLIARFSFDRLALTWAKNDRRTPADLQEALANTQADAFNVPGAGPLAPLTHLSVHAYDIRGPLSIDTPITPAAARQVLDEITQGKHAISASLREGLHIEAADAGWSVGQGQHVIGPAGVLLSALSGRVTAIDQLRGDGTATLRRRLT